MIFFFKTPSTCISMLEKVICVCSYSSQDGGYPATPNGPPTHSVPATPNVPPVRVLRQAGPPNPTSCSCSSCRRLELGAPLDGAAAAAPMPTRPQVVREVVVLQPITLTTFFGEKPVRTICVHCQQRVTTVVSHVPGTLAWTWCILMFFM